MARTCCVGCLGRRKDSERLKSECERATLSEHEPERGRETGVGGPGGGKRHQTDVGVPGVGARRLTGQTARDGLGRRGGGGGGTRV